jgi:hypothetical protein
LALGKHEGELGMVKLRSGLVVISLSAFWLSTFLCSLGACQSLGEDLRALEQLKRGRETAFDQVEAKGAAMLAKYPAAEDRGRIYWTLAGVYSQTGQQIPEKTILYCKAALDCPISPIKRRLALYNWWGDAILALHRGPSGVELVAARRQAVMPFLMGLRIAKDASIPDVPLNAKSPPLIDGSADSGDGQLGTRLAERERQVAEVMAAKERDEAVPSRDALVAQVAFLYASAPYANEELKRLATEVLQDPGEVARVMTALESAITHKSQRSLPGASRAK